jgi:cardiolipin synthase A/B
MSRSIIVLPDDSARPVLDAINGATKSLRIKMFVFSDPEVLKAVIAAQKRGVKVQVMLNPARRSCEVDNEEARARLTEGGVEVLDSNRLSTSPTRSPWWSMTRTPSSSR